VGPAADLGARREQLITATSSQVQQMRDLLECVWPAVLQAAWQPFRSRTWLAGLSIFVERDGGDLARTRRLGAARFEHAIRRDILKRGGQKPCLRIMRTLFAALDDPAGVTVHRAGALERVQLLLEDWRYAHQRLDDTETRMLAVLEELQLTELVTSITGVSAIGAAEILAQTGDPPVLASEVLTVDIDLAQVARRRRAIPLVKEARLGLIRREVDRLLREDGDL
jgi:hypothetical protein